MCFLQTLSFWWHKQLNCVRTVSLEWVVKNSEFQKSTKLDKMKNKDELILTRSQPIEKNFTNRHDLCYAPEYLKIEKNWSTMIFSYPISHYPLFWVEILTVVIHININVPVLAENTQQQFSPHILGWKFKLKFLDCMWF